MPTETKYIEGLQANNEKVIEEIYDKYSSRIFKMIKSYGGNIQDGEDIFQESLISIMKRSRDKNFKLRHSFYKYLETICRNIWIGNKKKEKRRVIFPEKIDPNYEPLTEFEDNLILIEKFIKEKFDKFPGKKCKDLILLIVNGKKLKDVYLELNYNNVKTATQQLYKCRQRLKDFIQKDSRYKQLLTD